MRRPVVVPIGEWLPDLPDRDIGGALEAKNCIPEAKSYRSLNDLSAFSDALTNACVGAFWARDDSGTLFNFAGDSGELYNLLADNTWDAVGGASAPYSASNWDFAKFGERVIAVSDGDTPQYWDMGTSSAFADLPNAPTAARVGVVRDFVVLGDMDTLGPSYVVWSGYNNSEIWTPSVRTQSDQQQLFGRAGSVQRIVPGEYGVIFCENSIYRMTYEGPPTVFRFDEVERRRGTPAPNSVVWSGPNVWYYSHDGFYYFDGVKSIPISDNRIAKWFQDNAAVNALDTMRGAIDRRNRLIIWAFKSTSSAAQNNRLLIYNWSVPPRGRWSWAEVDTQIIEEYVTPGLTLDQLDTPLPNGIDTDSIPVDSLEFAGGSLSLQAFNASNQSATFSGSPLVAELDTKEDAPKYEGRRIVNAVRPLVEGSSQTVVTAAVGTRNTLRGSPSFTAFKGENGLNGEINHIVNARYARYRLSISGGFRHANGVALRTPRDGGSRL
jgi:hypothetical protein